MDLSYFTERISQAFSEYLGGILQSLPAIGAGVLLLLVGWGLARLLRMLVDRIFKKTGLHGVAERTAWTVYSAAWAGSRWWSARLRISWCSCSSSWPRPR